VSGRARKLPLLTLVALAALLAAVLVAVPWLEHGAGRIDSPAPAAPADAPGQAAQAAQATRGEYLTLAGNCAGCHTARGGEAYAGGRGIDTPFGVVYAGNLTPDTRTGLGDWSADDFWSAMHLGRSRDGRLLYPAFPYPDYTRVTREDSDAIFAWLRTLPAVEQPNREHALRFPYGLQATLAGWRALFFRPGIFRPDPNRDAQWNRGAYLVQGLGHCAACHASRNAFGGTTDARGLGGGMIPMQGWYAPSLASSAEAGVARWSGTHIVELLAHGITDGASTLGPMAEVVFRSTQYLTAEDLAAIAAYLQSLPDLAPTPTPDGNPSVTNNPATAPSTERMARGAAVYRTHCADCHGDTGEGRPGHFPALAGNRAVTMAVPANVIRVVLAGGYPPGTSGNPKPFGMPPFATILTDAEVADVVTYVRNAWGHVATGVQTHEAALHRGTRRE
jgi:mono/diheme cytochrome c family protein